MVVAVAAAAAAAAVMTVDSEEKHTVHIKWTIDKEVKPGQMQAPEITTSGFKSSMTLKPLSLGNNSDDELH